jgi:alpha-galactosidase/6-phospho-beta-glucosidase family protein
MHVCKQILKKIGQIKQIISMKNSYEQRKLNHSKRKNEIESDEVQKWKKEKEERQKKEREQNEHIFEEEFEEEEESEEELFYEYKFYFVKGRNNLKMIEEVVNVFKIKYVLQQ